MSKFTKRGKMGVRMNKFTKRGKMGVRMNKKAKCISARMLRALKIKIFQKWKLSKL